MIELGNTVRDDVTGFEGIATARAEYINGCIQYCVTPTIDDKGAMRAGEWLDHQRLHVIASAIGTTVPIRAATGGPQRDLPPTG